MGQIQRQWASARGGDRIHGSPENRRSTVVPPSQADEIRQLYEPLIEAQAHQTDTAAMEQLCDNIKQLLMRPNWRAQVSRHVNSCQNC